MKHILNVVFALSLITTPALAQTTVPEPEQGRDLMEEGAKLLLRGLLSEMAPAIDELQNFAEDFGPRLQLFTQEMGPAFADLMDQVDDLAHYEAPIFLSNGDIIMRRRENAPDFRPEGAHDIEL